jgi:hypothetical protein
LADNLKYAGQSQEPDAAKIEWTCEVIGLDYADLTRQAEEAIPYPKSWAKLNEDGTPKKAAAKADKAKVKTTAKVKAASKKAKKPTKKAKARSTEEVVEAGMKIEEEAAAEALGTSYKDGKGKVLFVHHGLGGDSWGTYWRGKSRGTHRVVTKNLPIRKSQAEAQKDLDAYAKKHGFEPCEDNDS